MVLLDFDWLTTENIYVFINAVSGFCDILLPPFGSRLEKYKNVNCKEGARWSLIIDLYFSLSVMMITYKTVNCAQFVKVRVFWQTSKNQTIKIL